MAKVNVDEEGNVTDPKLRKVFDEMRTWFGAGSDEQALRRALEAAKRDTKGISLG